MYRFASAQQLPAHPAEMSVAVFALRAFLFTCLLMVFGVRLIFAAEPLLLIGQSQVGASFVGATGDVTLQFQVAGQPRHVSEQDLVRWSTAPTNLQQSELLLADGSRLALAAAWAGKQPWQIVGDSVSITTRLLGEVDLQRNQVRAIVLHAPAGLQQRTQFLDQLRSDNKGSDELRLTNGDQLMGQLVGLSKNNDGQRQINFLLESASQSLPVPVDRIAAIVLGKGENHSQLPGKLVVGLRDGSLLMAESLSADAGQLRLRLACNVEVTGGNSRDVTYLRSLSPTCIYLSDLVTIDYQHVPYLDIPWAYRRDRNVLKGPLQAAGGCYNKGLGMHTASRLTYRLDTEEIAGRFRRFVAAIAIDDVAAQRGSVIFRVYLERDGNWQQAYTSAVVRGGDRPLPVTVELDGARQLALATDFADRGDQQDYANWLEARLE